MAGRLSGSIHYREGLNNGRALPPMVFADLTLTAIIFKVLLWPGFVASISRKSHQTRQLDVSSFASLVAFVV
jgi:hypothetical protein